MPGLFPKFVHWAARVLALLVTGFCLYLFLGEVIAPHSRAPVGFAEWGVIALLVIVVIWVALKLVKRIVIGLIAVVLLAVLFFWMHYGELPFS